MTGFISKLFSSHVEPVTHLNTPPAPRDAEREKEVKQALNDLVHAKIDIERKSWQVREELAGQVIKIVAGE